MHKNKKNIFKYFMKNFFTLKLSNPNTGKKFKAFNFSIKVFIASLFSGYLAFGVFIMFFLSALVNPAKSQIRRKLKSSTKLKSIEYSLLNNAEVLGHRGVREGAVENTLSAIQKASDDKADGIEIDIRFTKDSVPILLHDPSLKINKKNKNTERKIRNLTFEEVKKIKINNEKIPTLEQVLKLTKKLDLIVNIEIKPDPKLKSKELKIVLDLIDKYCDIHKLSISSFDEGIITKIKEKRPEIITGLINYGYEWDWLKKAKKAKANYVNFHLMGLQLNQMEKIILCKQNNFAIKTWPVNDLKTAHELINAGIDGIISDNPKVLMHRKQYS